MARKLRQFDDDENSFGVRRQKPKVEPFTLMKIQPLTQNQTTMIDLFESGLNIVAAGTAGTGKAQPLYSKVLTDNGWELMGNLKEGDVVITPSGVKSKILSIHPQGIKKVFKITFSDGASTECCADHLWLCNIPKDLYRTGGSEQKVVDTNFLMSWLDNKNKKINEGKKIRVNISIPLIKSIEGDDVDLKMHPYILGVLLGDGCLSSLTPTITSNDIEVVEYVNKFLEKGYYLSKRKSQKYGYAIINDKRQKNFYGNILKEFGLFGKKSFEKFIPEEYMNTSVNQKIQLLRGLLDTDGTAGKKGDISFSTTSKKLATQVQYLIWSIGGKASIKVKQPFFTYKNERKKGRIAYNVSLSYINPKQLFNIKRKQQRVSEVYEHKQLVRQIVSIDYVDDVETQCIFIDNQDHLYITDDFIVTHNTYIATYLALQKLLSKSIEKIVIVRSAVNIRSQGFLPGTLEEKESIFTIPYKTIVDELCQSGTAWECLTKKKFIEFISTSYIRGLTLKNCVVIVDEFQNLDISECESMLSRLGENCQVIICGDTRQNDLSRKREQSCYEWLMRLMGSPELEDWFDVIQFNKNDIVRGELCKAIITAIEKM